MSSCSCINVSVWALNRFDYKPVEQSEALPWLRLNSQLLINNSKFALYFCIFIHMEGFWIEENKFPNKLNSSQSIKVICENNYLAEEKLLFWTEEFIYSAMKTRLPCNALVLADTWTYRNESVTNDAEKAYAWCLIFRHQRVHIMLNELTYWGRNLLS